MSGNLSGRALALGLGVILSCSAIAQQKPVELIGINVAGAAFASSHIPGKHGTNFFFPPKGYYTKWQQKGISWVRFSIQWERLQPKANAEFDESYAKLIDKTLTEAHQSGIEVMLDVHNYGRYYGKVIGTDDVPISAYRNLMERIAKRWGNNPAVYSYDLMNEPYGAANKFWPEVAQAGIDGVRKHDSRNAVYVEGAQYSSATQWPKLNDALLDLKDPANNIVYSAHMYIDPDSSGSYKQALAPNLDPEIGVKRIAPFVNWLIKHNKKGHIGEFGVPADDESGLKALDHTLAYLQKHCIPFTYWAAGPSWGKHKLSIEPVKGVDRPQWAVLQKYLGGGNCTSIGPGT
ncbi:glycoside hydrolase family 5 protein [Phytopseudomonas seleniipraecipitans]|uniref:Endoglucanase n=1 Tax=Phytopseudomonas seleniipraecipitans TaxID=640205 RepID=A0A1G7S7S0_9GAMM|nr:glycoside hydrolase family 5 protein [Pseudomonas seleniipraecipitans]SDG18992.1 endoglucanase [Pseudomonas seleniipraecipitans]